MMQQAMQRWTHTVVGAALMVGVLMAPTPALADSYLKEAGLGTASAFSTFIYAPVKIAYAAVGGVVGGLGYVLSAGSLDVAKKIFVTSLGGTYVITPQMLQGNEPIRFIGSSTSDGGTADVQY